MEALDNSWSTDANPKEGASNPGRRCFSGDGGGGSNEGEGGNIGVALSKAMKM